MWTKADKRFLHAMCIVATDPPSPLPRFRVEVGPIEGEHQVIDTARGFRAYIFGKDWPDPRAAAESVASSWNERHAMRT